MSARHGWAHIRAYCTCGGKLDARSEPPEAAEAVHATFRQLHSGEGSGVQVECECQSHAALRAVREGNQ